MKTSRIQRFFFCLEVLYETGADLVLATDVALIDYREELRKIFQALRRNWSDVFSDRYGKLWGPE